MRTASCVLLSASLLGVSDFALGQTPMKHDLAQKCVTLSDPAHGLELRLNYDNRCVLDRVRVRGHEVSSPTSGVFSGIQVGGVWFTTRPGIATPKVAVTKDRVYVTGILFGGGGVEVEESWTLLAKGDHVEWRIDRRYLAPGSVDDTACPQWDFKDMTTWTGAILGTGGVAWCRLFDAANATYGIHTDFATFWNPTNDLCFRIRAQAPTMAMKFVRQPDGTFTLLGEPTAHELQPKHGQYRFHRSRQDVWAPFEVKAGDTTSVTYTLKGHSYDETFDRGVMKGLDGRGIREILNTIGRIGVIDDRIMGSNGWYSGYAVLHEPWFALMGLAVDDPSYTRNFARTLDYQRDHAIAADGMVKSRWAYFTGDATPGTYDSLGFYECQWGRLMDTQPSYVINVAEQFDLTGDLTWAKGQKAACEKVLGYLLDRDTNGNHLVEALADSRTEHLASDWLDVIWASYETAFVNAQLYRALVAWADVEDALGDGARATDYRTFAKGLKATFNKPIDEGGFWDPANAWYVYWREKDGSVHGNNLTLPVNFMAIAYGLCDEPSRKRAILEKVEAEMVSQKLFCWPANIFPFTADETSNQPFPTYENGDIFLAWAETGIRAYAEFDPRIAVKYVKNLLARYKLDGLAFQRYLRSNQAGAGDDILANNCSAVVGLYRNVYGIQPKPNRLCLDPHLTAELAGTRLRYTLRGRVLTIGLSPGVYEVESKGWSIACGTRFGVAFGDQGMDYFREADAHPALSIRAPRAIRLGIAGDRRWTLSTLGKKTPVGLEVMGLKPGRSYRLKVNGTFSKRETASPSGSAVFKVTVGEKALNLELDGPQQQ